MLRQETIQKVSDCLEGSRKLSKQDGDLIAILYKTATTLQEKLDKVSGESDAKSQELEQVKASLSQKIQEKPSTFDRKDVEPILKGAAEEGFVDSEHVNEHVDKIMSEPGHLLKIMELQQQGLKEMKQASEETLGRVGKLAEDSGESGRKPSSFNRETSQKTQQMYDELERNCSAWLREKSV